MILTNPRIAYFGGEPIGTPIFSALCQNGFKPALVICNPDRPSGRGHQLTPPPLKLAAQTQPVNVWQPESFKDKDSVVQILSGFDIFIVVAYNKILPQWLIELPPYQTLNVHPSLLPLRRGSNPIRSAIIEDDRASVGVSVMRLDKEMDHGPILAQEALNLADSEWPLPGRELDSRLATLGGNLLCRTLPDWINGDITPTEQNHDQATYTKKVTKDMGEIKLDPYHLPQGDAARVLYLAYLAYDGWPGTFFFYNGTRYKITKAELTAGQFRPLAVIPAGKKETSFSSLFNSLL